MNPRKIPLVVTAVLLVAGCGGDEDKTAPFVGTWTVTTGTLSGMCQGLPAPFTQKLDGGQQTITKTADGALSMTILSGCNIILDVSGNVATLRATTPPQTCMFPFMFMGTSVPVMATFTSGTFTLTGSTASFAYAGNAAAGILSCMVNGMGTSMKGVAAEAGSPADTGAPVDAGSPADTGSSADASSPAEAGASVDAGSPAEAGSPADTGSGTGG